MTETKRFEVVAAIFINESNEVFCARRKNDGNLSLKWEFPGGKVEDGEDHKQALIREIKEELDLEISVNNFYMSVDYDYEDFSISLSSYVCTIISGTIKLNVHKECLWISLDEIEKLDWAKADMPIVKKLLQEKNNLFLKKEPIK